MTVNAWTERDVEGRVWWCWYDPMRDPRESRSRLTRILIGRVANYDLYDVACAELTRTLGGGTYGEIEWNDAPGRTQAEVVQKLREVAGATS